MAAVKRGPSVSALAQLVGGSRRSEACRSITWEWKMHADEFVERILKMCTLSRLLEVSQFDSIFNCWF